MKKFEVFAIVAATMLGGLVLVPLPSALAADSIVGTWKLQSWVREIIATGKRENVLGEKPGGYITYSTDGRMMAIAVAGDRIKPNSFAPTDEEKVKLYNTFISYAGTYKIDGDKVVHSVDISWNQALTGTNLVRHFKIESDTLTITVPTQKNAFDGQEARGVLIFKKVP
jgi:Lipocalin-like domain